VSRHRQQPPINWPFLGVAFGLVVVIVAIALLTS
jgi:hypothetical protein